MTNFQCMAAHVSTTYEQTLDLAQNTDMIITTGIGHGQI